MRILHVGAFHGLDSKSWVELPAAVPTEDWIFARAFRELGHEVIEFARPRIAKLAALTFLRAVYATRPDFIFLGKVTWLSPRAVAFALKRHACMSANWWGDALLYPCLYDVGALVDWTFITSGGDRLREAHHMGRRRVAYIPNPIDPTVFRRLPDVERIYDCVFVGNRYGVRRREILDLLEREGLVHVAGDRPENRIFGHDYVRLINAARIGLGINSLDCDFHRFVSDRMGHFIACGTFFLTQYFPRLDELFNHDEVDWFTTASECRDKIRHYLKNPAERERKAERAMHKVQESFSHLRVAQYILDTVTGRRTSPWWADVWCTGRAA